MPKLLDLLSQLEDAIPEMKAALEGNPDYMDGDMDKEEPDADEAGGPPDMDMDDMEGGEMPADLEEPPPFPGKKKKPALPF